MSLIDEALKKARQEAARQDAAEREARYARVPTYVPPSHRPRPWLLPAVVSACLAVGVAGGVVISRHPSVVPPESPHPLAPSPAAPPALPGRGGTLAAGVEKPAAEKTAEKPVEEPVVEEQSEPSPPSPGEGERAFPPPPQKVPAPAAEPEPAPEPPPSAPPSPPSPEIALPQPAPTPAPEPAPAAPVQLTETRSYVREVPVPGGGTLRLNGIAFSSQPVALFGDKVVAPGESVSGFTVVAVEAQRVKLQGPGGTVYVTLK
jgi:hypothetical protein